MLLSVDKKLRTKYFFSQLPYHYDKWVELQNVLTDKDVCVPCLFARGLITQGSNAKSLLSSVIGILIVTRIIYTDT